MDAGQESLQTFVVVRGFECGELLAPALVSAPLKKADLLAVAEHVISTVPYNRIPLLAKRHKVETIKPATPSVESLQKHIRKYDEDALCRLLLEISLLDSAYRTSSNNETDALLNTAKRYRTDPEKLKKSVAQEFGAKQKKEQQKTATSKQGA